MHFTHSHPSRRRPAALAALTTIAIATGSLLALAVAAPAAAHTGDMKATAVCNSETGDYDVTYSLTLAQAAGKIGETRWKIGEQQFVGTPSSAAGMDRGPIASTGNATITLGTATLPGTTTGAGPWAYAFTTWKDGYGRGSDTRAEGLKGGCAVPIPEEPAPYVDRGEWGSWTADCAASAATRTRWSITVDWRWDDSSHSWRDDVRSAETTETETRTATTEECPLPELPSDSVDYGSWSTPHLTCANTAGDELPVTRTVTTTAYTRGEDALPVATTTTSTEDGTYVVTPTDAIELDCPVATPTETPKPTTPEKPAPPTEHAAALAQTGGDLSPALPIAGALLAAIGIALLSPERVDSDPRWGEASPAPHPTTLPVRTKEHPCLKPAACAPPTMHTPPATRSPATPTTAAAAPTAPNSPPPTTPGATT